MSDLSLVQQTADEYAARIGFRGTTIFLKPQGDGTPYVEVSEGYHFIVEERGQELERRCTGDVDQLLYWLFDGITFSLACAAELQNRRPNEDPRRQLFERQEQLLSKISAAWERRKIEDHRLILERHPFQDMA